MCPFIDDHLNEVFEVEKMSGALSPAWEEGEQSQLTVSTMGQSHQLHKRWFILLGNKNSQIGCELWLF